MRLRNLLFLTVICLGMLAWCLALSGIASGATLGVGANEPYKTLADGVGHALAGDTIEVTRGDYTLPAQIDFAKPNVTVHGNGSTLRMKLPDSRFGPDATQAVYVHAGAAGLVLDNFQFTISNGKAIRVDAAPDVTLSNLTFDGSTQTADGVATPGGYWNVEATQTSGLKIVNYRSALTAGYGIYLHRDNRNTAITNPSWVGAAWQHSLRDSDQDGLLIDGGRLIGIPQSGIGNKHIGGLTLRGGVRNVTVKNAIIDRPGVGAQTAEENQTVDNIVFENCTILNGVWLHPTTGEIANAARTNPAGARLMKLPTRVMVNGTWLIPPPPSTQPADVAKALGTRIKAIQGMPAAAWPMIDQLAGMVK